MGADGQNVEGRLENGREDHVASSKRNQVGDQKLVSPKVESWCMSVEGFRDHVTTDDSLLGVSGKWSACGWSVVQLDEMGANARDASNLGRRS